ncbi:MAG: glycosyltransferase family 4 protein [Acidobacteriota bacterium]
MQSYRAMHESPPVASVAPDRPWRILLTNVTLAGRTGTETATRALAIGLLAAGHTPMVYAPTLGAIADDLRAAGIPVVDRLDALPKTPDIIHGHHHVETVAALLTFPAAAAVFVCHDRSAVASAPPLIDRIQRYVAVDFNCLERLTADYGIPTALTTVIPNAIEMDRFRPRGPLPPHPRRAAIFSNYAQQGTHLEPTQQACGRLGLPLDVLGSGVGNEQAAPELVLGAYDLVFAKARCAIEAMAVGCAVVLCDATGLGPMVTSANVDDLRWWNFGRRTLRAPLDVHAIVAAVRGYDADDAREVSSVVRHTAGLGSAVNSYLAVYRAALSNPLAVRGFEQDVRDYATRAVQHLSAVEAALAEYRRPFRMEALTDDECAKVRIRILKSPVTVNAAATLRVETEVRNGLTTSLGTFPPYPVDLSYRWLDAATGEPLVAEGARTSLPSIAAGEDCERAMQIAAPTQPGIYRLRIALVQEGLRWLDYLQPPVADEVTVSVVIPADSRPA